MTTLSVEIHNALITKVRTVPLVKVFDLASQKEICTARGWLQRHIQEIEWDKNDKKRAKTYMRSVIMGAAMMDPIIFVPINLVERGLNEKLVNAISEDEKESIQDSLATVRKDIASGGQYYCIDGQNRIFKSIVPFFNSILCTPSLTACFASGSSISSSIRESIAVFNLL